MAHAVGNITLLQEGRVGGPRRGMPKGRGTEALLNGARQRGATIHWNTKAGQLADWLRMAACCLNEPRRLGTTRVSLL
jgi:hypothetical protein